MEAHMLRFVLVAAFSVFTLSPAVAQDVVDPAVAACEALARDIAGTSFQGGPGYTMVGRTVFIQHDSKIANGEYTTCNFKLDEQAGQWTFDPKPSGDAALCLQITNADTTPAFRELPQVKLALEKCAPKLKAEEVRAARLVVVDEQLRKSGRYPINQQDTQLKPGP
jgi:hypothetical protein